MGTGLQFSWCIVGVGFWALVRSRRSFCFRSFAAFVPVFAVNQDFFSGHQFHQSHWATHGKEPAADRWKIVMTAEGWIVEILPRLGTA